MSTQKWRYFVTDEELKAKHWDTLLEAKSLKSRLAELEKELDKFTSSWRVAGNTCRRGFDLQTDDKSLIVRNPSLSMKEIERFPIGTF